MSNSNAMMKIAKELDAAFTRDMPTVVAYAKGAIDGASADDVKRLAKAMTEVYRMGMEAGATLALSAYQESINEVLAIVNKQLTEVTR